MFKSRRQDKTIVGLELDPSHLAAAEVHVNGSITVKKGAVAELRPGILRDGEVQDVVALSDELRTLFSENNLGTRVRLGRAALPWQRSVTQTVTIRHSDSDHPPLGQQRSATCLRMVAV